MPELEVGEWSQHGPFLIWARMLFPDDQKRYEEFIAVTLKKASLQDQNEANPLYRALDPFKYLNEGNTNNNALAAGAVLVTIRIIAEKYPVRAASLNKAYEVIWKQFRGDGPLPANKRDLQKAWKTFQPVSHLWAALWLYSHEMGSLDQTAEALSELSTFRVFLAIAENMCDFGEAYQIHRSKTYLLPAGTMWRTPQNILLPEVDLSMPPLTPGAEHALKDYRA